MSPLQCLTERVAGSPDVGAASHGMGHFFAERQVIMVDDDIGVLVGYVIEFAVRMWTWHGNAVGEQSNRQISLPVDS